MENPNQHLRLVVNNGNSVVVNKRKPLFSPGQIVFYGDWHAHVEDVALALRRYLSGDWGDIAEGDRPFNAIALEKGGALLGNYSTPDGATIRMFTGGDRKRTEIVVLNR